MSAARWALILSIALEQASAVSILASEPKPPPGTIISINGRQTGLPNASASQGTPRNVPGKKVATLKERLEKDLKARRPREFAFVARVVALVDKGVLSRRLVDSTYLWARAKRRHPFQYFQYALTVRARRRGLRL